jgi:hypothetical protein
MSLFYVLAGLYLVFSEVNFMTINKEYKIFLGILIFLYGIYRIYRAFKATNKQDEE